jgi:hypothetical protein
VQPRMHAACLVLLHRCGLRIEDVITLPAEFRFRVLAQTLVRTRREEHLRGCQIGCRRSQSTDCRAADGGRAQGIASLEG